MTFRRLELDAIRGVAALAVVMHHCLLVLDFGPETKSKYWLLWETPLRALFAGNEAVTMFFILSGYVLTIPFIQTNQKYANFIIKRIFRIYPAYLLAVTITFLAQWIIKS